MTKEFKLGDRVKLRGHDCDGIRVDGKKGSITEITHTMKGEDLIIVAALEGVFYVTPSQCVRLRKKPRREWWISPGSSINSPDLYGPFVSQYEPEKWDSRRELIHVREVRKPKP